MCGPVDVSDGSSRWSTYAQGPANTRGARRALEQRCAPVNGELRFAVENHEHLFTIVMEVMPNAALRLDDAAVQEEQIGIQAVTIEQGHVVQLAGAMVDRFRRPVLSR